MRLAYHKVKRIIEKAIAQKLTPIVEPHFSEHSVIAVSSSTAANRVMHTTTKWIEKKLGLKVNAKKTKVTRTGRLKYLGFGCWKGPEG